LSWTASRSVVFGKDFVDVVYSGSAVYVVVDQEYGSKSAGAYAACRLEREFLVRGAFIGADAELVLKGLEDFSRAFNIAGRS